MLQVVINVFFSTESLPEDGQGRLKHGILLPHVIHNYSAVIGICIWSIISL